MIFFSMHLIGADSEDGDVNVNVQGKCSVYSSTFAPPGGDQFAVNNTDYTLNALAKNDTGYFYYNLVNSGNLNASTMYEIDIRPIDDPSDNWSSGDELLDLSDQNSSYEPEQVDLNSTDGGPLLGFSLKYFFKTFRASYPAGNYKARLQVNYSCYNRTADGDPIYSANLSGDLDNHTYNRYTEFRILDAQGTGSGVEQDEYPSDDPFPSESNVTTENSTNYTAPQTGGNDTSELERPTNANRTGNYTTNMTVPADANRTGETSDQTIEGDNDNPGQTPEPEPEPTPAPGDSPTPGQSDSPRLAIDIEPTNNTYPAYQGEYAPAELQVENIGDAAVNDLRLIPEIGEIRPGWQVRNATVSNLSVNETVTRDVFIRPPEDQPTGEYLVPVRAQNPDAQLDLDYFTMRVLQSRLEPKVEIAEAPRTVSIQTGASQQLPILVRNPGGRNITNVTAELQNAEDCGEISTSQVSMIDINGTASLNIGIDAGENAQECEATLIVSTANGAYSFSDLTINTRPDEGLIPQEQRVPFIAIAWTFVLAAYAIMRKRYGLNSSLVKIPFFMLLMGETVIILYMLVNYYGVLSLSFLPF